MRLVISCVFVLVLALPIMGFANEDLRRGQALLKDGQYSDAIEALQAGVKKSPRDVRGQIDLAQAQYEAGQVDQAARSLQQARKLGPKGGDKELADLLDKRIVQASKPMASSATLVNAPSQSGNKTSKHEITPEVIRAFLSEQPKK
jgi:tetratricopeptide (TPR) repeat protein